MIKFLIWGIVILVVYRMWNANVTRLPQPNDDNTPNIDDSEMVDYEEIE